MKPGTSLSLSLTLFLLLPACGRSGGPAGSWVLDTSAIQKEMEKNGKKDLEQTKRSALAKEFLKQSMAALLENAKVRILLEENGSFRITSCKEGPQAKPLLSGTWTFEKDVVLLKPLGKEGGDRTFPEKLRYQGDKLIPIHGGDPKTGISMIFVRE